MHAESSVSALKRVANNAAIIDIIQTSEEMSYNLPSWEGTRTVLISYIVPYIDSCNYHIICYLNRDIFYFSVASKTEMMGISVHRKFKNVLLNIKVVQLRILVTELLHFMQILWQHQTIAMAWACIFPGRGLP